MPAKRKTPEEPKYETREQWLYAAVDILRPAFKQAGNPVPEEVRVSWGFTGSRNSRKHVLGSCWAAEASADGHREIFISPTAEPEPMFILGILAHELCHACLPHDVKHKKEFVELGKSVLLEGKATEMGPGLEFESKYAEPVKSLGPFPGAMLSRIAGTGGGSGNKKRKLKVACDECGCTFRIAEKWITEKNLRCIDADCPGGMVESTTGE